MQGDTARAGGRIVVGVDGRAATLTAVRWAAQEALMRQASVHLVLVRDRPVRAPYSGVPKAALGDEDGADGRVPLVTAKLEAGWILPPGRLSSELADGSPAKVLIGRSAGAALLVLGRACREGLSAGEAPPPVGPVSRACLKGAACPVVVVATSDAACPSACIYPAPGAARAGPPPAAMLPAEPGDAMTGSQARARAEDLMTRTVEVAVRFAAVEDRLAATFGELAVARPEKSAHYQVISQAAGGVARRARQWAEAHAATG